MKQKTKLLVLMTSFCFVLATCLLSVFAAKNFSLNSSGIIEFVAPGIEATISEAILSGVSKKEGSGQMQSFTLTQDMTASQIASLSGVQSWSGIKLAFDEDANGMASISFTITNNSNKTTENIMVEISTNTTYSSPIQATPSEDFCIAPNSSHTFSVNLSVSDLSNSVTLGGFKIVVNMKMLKPSEVVSIEEYSSQGFEFETSSQTSNIASLKKYTGTETNIEIPAVIKDSNGGIYNVTEIKSNANSNSSAFSSVKSIVTSIKMPKTLTVIGDYAFISCSMLEDLNIPSSVKTIGKRAFAGCSGITGDLLIPQNVVTIGEYAFFLCDGFDGSLILPNGLSSIGDSVFYDCSKIKGNLVIPNSLKIISNHAFSGCEGFTGDLIIPNTVTKIGDFAFASCTGMTGDLIIPDSVLTIGKNAFYKLSGMNGSLIIGKNVISIGEYAFQECKKLSCDIVIGEKVTYVGMGAFRECKRNSITVDPANEMYYSKGNCLISKTDKVLVMGCDISQIPQNDGITKIEAYAFYYCNNWNATLTIPTTLTSIGSYAFYRCSKLTGDVNIPYGATTIGVSAFEYCTALNGTLTIPATVTSIGSYAFAYCRILNGALVLPNSITSIADGTFTECGISGDCIIPDSVVSIGRRAFWGCGINGTFTIGRGVNSIGGDALLMAHVSSVIVLPTTPPKINKLFSDEKLFSTSNQHSIHVPAESLEAYQTATEWSEYASRISAIVEGEQIDANGVLTTQTESKYTGVVYQIDTSTGRASIKANSNVSATEIVVFDEIIYNGATYSVDTIAASAFAGNTNLTKITIPSTITTIEPKAFMGCTNLTNIVFENTANWHASITKESTYGSAVSVTNIANFTSTYCNFYIKSRTYKTALNLAIKTHYYSNPELTYYLQYTDGMTWADLAANSELNCVSNNIDNSIGQFFIYNNYVLYNESIGMPAPQEPDFEYTSSSSVISSSKIYNFHREFSSAVDFLIEFI